MKPEKKVLTNGMKKDTQEAIESAKNINLANELEKKHIEERKTAEYQSAKELLFNKGFLTKESEKTMLPENVINMASSLRNVIIEGLVATKAKEASDFFVNATSKAYTPTKANTRRLMQEVGFDPDMVPEERASRNTTVYHVDTQDGCFVELQFSASLQADYAKDMVKKVHNKVKVSNAIRSEFKTLVESELGLRNVIKAMRTESGEKLATGKPKTKRIKSASCGIFNIGYSLVYGKISGSSAQVKDQF